MLKSIVVVTLLVISADRSEEVYRDSLGYQTVDEGQVSASLAEHWTAPGAVGRDYVLMKPDSESEVYLRFVEAGGQGNYAPMKTLGWNAVEIQVEDPDTLVAGLPVEHFELIGPPKFLTDQNNVRAAQVLGPDRELLYFTQVVDPTKSTFQIGQATSWVDRVFIMVVGTPDIAATTAFYQETLGQPVSGPWPYRVTVLSEAWGKPSDTMYDLSIAQLEEPFLVEIDGYPEEAEAREDTPAGLPFGPAVVGFLMQDLTPVEQRLGRRGRALAEAPYDGRDVLLLRGPAGERLELIELQVAD